MSLDTPALVMARLEAIEQDLALRQMDLEQAALDWFRAKRDREKKWAEAYLEAEGTDGARRAQANIAAVEVGKEFEAAWEGLKAVVRVLDTRAAIGMAILKAQGRS